MGLLSSKSRSTTTNTVNTTNTTNNIDDRVTATDQAISIDAANMSGSINIESVDEGVAAAAFAAANDFAANAVQMSVDANVLTSLTAIDAVGQNSAYAIDAVGAANDRIADLSAAHAASLQAVQADAFDQIGKTVDGAFQFGARTFDAAEALQRDALDSIQRNTTMTMGFLNELNKDPEERAFTNATPWLAGAAAVAAIAFSFGRR